MQNSKQSKTSGEVTEFALILIKQRIVINTTG